VELAHEASQAVDLQVDVPDQVLGLPVPDVVHLLVAEHDEQLAEARRGLRALLDVGDVPAVGAEGLEDREPVVAHRGVLAVEPRVNRVPLDLDRHLAHRPTGRSAVIPTGVTVGSTARTGSTSTA